MDTKTEQERMSDLASNLTRQAFWLGATDEEYEGWWRWPDGTVLDDGL